ncbi:MAG: YlxR family protein [Oscillospiraceae bacterium]|nr:YlxR family protein [Oscillospiraceae bacterium]
MQKKKIPVRTCLGCGEPKEKKSLIRVVRSPEGEISMDLTGKKSGRGAYICPDANCLKKAKKAKRLEKSFECAIPEEVYEKLEAELLGREEQNG